MKYHPATHMAFLVDGGRKPSVDDPYLRPLLDAADAYGDSPPAREMIRSLILKAYQQGRARVIRDVAEQERKDNSVPSEPVLEHLRKIRQHVSAIELDTIRERDADLALTAEQAGKIAARIQQMLLKQARKNRE